MDLLDLNGPSGEDNDGGLRQLGFVAPMSYFAPAGLKGPKSRSAVATDEVTIDGAHAFEATKGFHPVYMTPDSEELKLEAVGERDGRGQKGTLEFFYPGSEKEGAVFARRVKNLSCIMLVETVEGNRLQLGGPGRGVEITGSYSSGKQSGGRRGWTFKCEYFTTGLHFYEGEVKLFDQTILPAVPAVEAPAEEPVAP
ncbi:hypothetical protein [Rufibacter roseus]|uniref:Uncharacterized protein n=1 Tax=Rufibacter roseus TaxID=1567108 RepID=A0ABW2DR78_9BACT|nr:hypothetical protein [Rufibacter roseus]